MRVKAAPLVEVLDRLASQTGMAVSYQRPPPSGTVSLAVNGANHAEAVLGVLEGLGVNYAATTNPTGTRILSIVVAGAARPDGARFGPETIEPPPTAADAGDRPDAPVPADISDGPEPADESEADEVASSEPGLSLLPDDFVPGVRATGQPTDWGIPPFVLPDPPDDAAGTDPGVLPEAGPDPARRR